MTKMFTTIFCELTPPPLHTMHAEKYTQLQPNKYGREAASSSMRCMKFDICPAKSGKKSKTSLSTHPSAVFPALPYLKHFPGIDTHLWHFQI